MVCTPVLSLTPECLALVWRDLHILLLTSSFFPFACPATSFIFPLASPATSWAVVTNKFSSALLNKWRRWTYPYPSPLRPSPVLCLSFPAQSRKPCLWPRRPSRVLCPSFRVRPRKLWLWLVRSSCRWFASWIGLLALCCHHSVSRKLRPTVRDVDPWCLALCSVDRGGWDWI